MATALKRRRANIADLGVARRKSAPVSRSKPRKRRVSADELANAATSSSVDLGVTSIKTIAKKKRPYWTRSIRKPLTQEEINAAFAEHMKMQRPKRKTRRGDDDKENDSLITVNKKLRRSRRLSSSGYRRRKFNFVLSF